MNTYRLAAALLLLVPVTALAGTQRSDPAVAEALEKIVSRLDSMEQRLNRLELGAAAPADAAGIAAQLESLDQEIRIVDRQRELHQEAVTASFAQSPAVGAGRDGFFLRSPDSAFQIRVGGYFQADGRFFTGPNQADNSTFVLRRIRPVLTGTIYRGIEFRLMPDWGQGVASLQDVHLDFRFFPKASIRFGKFKSPFSLERLQSATDLTFIERAHPTSLAPNRDTGVQLYGDFGAGTLSYAVAAMNGAVDGGSSDTDANDGKDFVARIFIQPFVARGTTHRGSGLGIGIAGSWGNQNGTGLPSYRSTPQSAFFSYAADTAADGERRRLGPQGYYYAGPFGVFAEYTISEQDLRRGSSAATIRNKGWQAAMSYVLTGEAKGYRAPAPEDPFDPKTGKKGAIEIAGRYTEISIDPDAFRLGFADPTRSASGAQEWTAGVNWYLARGSRFVINYSQTHFNGGSTTGSRSTEKAILTRFQVNF